MKQFVLRRSIVLVLVGLSTFSYGQWNNSYFDIERHDTTAGLLSLQVENLGYFRNVEYKTAIDEGRTLFGYQFWPEAVYQISDKAQVSAGIFVQRDFGSDEFYRNFPTFSFQYTTGVHRIRFGNLLGSMQHGLIEPLYDPERVIENRMENGFQYVLNHKRIKGEFWTDWRKMIYQNSPFREEFTVGLKVEPKLIDKEHHNISIPVAMLAFHKGGEIDTSHLPTVSNFNFDYALRYVYKPQGFIDSIDVQGHALYYEDISATPENYIDGLGQYVSLGVYAKSFGFMLNYWDSHQYHNPMGDVLFRTVSMRNSSYILDYRKLAMARLSWETKLAPDFNFLIRGNYIRDINHGSDNFVTEFYLRWTPFFGLKQIAK